MITEIYYKSHQALALGQKKLVGGAIGTTISGIASATLAAGILFAFGRGQSGIGAGCLFVGLLGFMQGVSRYPVHYYLNETLDTTAKKVMGLALEFLAATSIFFLFLGDFSYHPITLALNCSGITFPISIIANTILGLTFEGIASLIFTKKPVTHSVTGLFNNDVLTTTLISQQETSRPLT